MFDLLVGTGELAAAARAGAFVAGCGCLANYVGSQRTWAFSWKVVWSNILWTFTKHNIYNLRDDIAGTLDNNSVPDADVTAFAQRLSLAADALNVVLVVQRNILHDHTTDTDRLKL